MHNKSWRIVILGAVVTALLIACAHFSPSQPNLSPTSQSPQTLLVAAAASLQRALQDVTRLYPQTQSQSTLQYHFAASGAAQQQIEQGAPIDVFISASSKQMEALQAKGLLVSGSQHNLLTNRLVLIAPKPAKASIASLQDLAKPEVQRIAIGEPRSVPVGQYATEAFSHLGILQQVKSKFVLGNSTKAVLAAVESGAVDAGMVYLTDAQASSQVTIVTTIAETLHSPIHYPIAIVKSSRSIDESQQYVNFLQSQDAKVIFQKYGFGIAQASH